MLAPNPLTPAPRQPYRARRTKPVIGTDASGAVKCHANNVAEAAERMGVTRSAVWCAIRHDWLCAGLTWRYVATFPPSDRPKLKPYAQRMRAAARLPLPVPPPHPMEFERDRTPVEYERARFARALQLNPSITWDEWRLLQIPRGRRPKSVPQ